MMKTESFFLAPKPKELRRGGAVSLLLGVLVGLLLVPGVFIGGSKVPAAQAAEHGAGHSYGGVFVGAYITSSTQSNAYCAEPDGDNPTTEVSPKAMSSLRGYRMQSTGHWVAPYTSERGLKLLNYITSMHGGVALGPGWHDDQAAAVALAVWTVRGQEDSVVAAWVANIRSFAAPQVQSLTDSILDQAAEGIVSPAIDAPEDPVITWQTSTTGRIEVAAGYQQLRIESGGRLREPAPEGATFEAGGKTASLDGSSKVTLGFEKVSGATDSRAQEVKFSASWVKAGKRWPARVWGYQPAADDADQLLLYGGGPEDFSRSGGWQKASETSRENGFAPIVTTQVPQAKLLQGEPFADRVTFGIADGSEAWPSYWENGEMKHRPVRASGTLYGPFASPPAVSDEVPGELASSIAATAELIAVDGPGEYSVEVPADTEGRAGYYTWVWRIDGQNQVPEIQVGSEEHWHLDSRYSFQDRFGIPEETQFRPMELEIKTQLKDSELAPGGKTFDRISLISDGAWFERDGQAVPIVVRATVYETDGAPVRAATAPEGARVVATEKVTVQSPEEPGEIEVAAPLYEENGRVSARQRGVTVQACIVAEDQSEWVREVVTETCDDWGIPEESARIVLPSVETVAQKTGQVDGQISDTAKVEGVIPDDATLGFTAYLKAEVGEPRFDEQWRPMLDDSGEPLVWAEADFAGLSDNDVCELQPVARTARIPVSAPGNFASPEVTARSAGTIHWVEDLGMAWQGHRDPVEIHRGVCGLAAETTRVIAPDTQESLPRTGAVAGFAITGSCAFVIVAAGVWLVVQARSRKAKVTE